MQRWVKFVKYMTTMGIEPFVLTVHPDYATYPQTDLTLEKDIPDNVQVFYTKSFELYSLYKKISSNKEVPYGGFSNTRKLDIKEKILRFIRGNFIIPDPRKGWNKYAIKKAKELIRLFQIDTVITTSPPHSTQLIGLQLKNQLDIKWLADLRDPWTDIYYFRQMYPTFLAKWLHRRLEKKVLTRADKITTVSHSLKKLFAQKADGVYEKIEIIPNGFDNTDFQDFIKMAPTDVFYISYVGTISKEYNLKGFIQAIQELPGQIQSKIKIRFIGEMPSHLVERFAEAGLSSMLEFTGYVSHNLAINFMISSDALLLVIPDVKNNEGILTGKLFEYLASKRPILFIGPEHGDAAKIIRDTNSGLICGYTEHQKIKNEIINLLEKKGAEELINAPSNVSKYSRESLTSNLVKLLDTL